MSKLGPFFATLLLGTGVSMIFKPILFLSLIVFGLESFALQISLDTPPGDYRVYSLRGSHLTNKTYAQNYSDFSFTVPDQYIVKNSDGTENLILSLQNWRRSTPIADGNPRTRGDIGYYPFKDSQGNNRYIALEHIYNNRRNVVNVSSTKTKIDISGNADFDSSTSSGETISAVTTISGQLNPNDLARETDEVSIDISGAVSEQNFDNELAASLRPQVRPANLQTAVPAVFRDDYPPSTARFSTRNSTAKSYTNSTWANMSVTQQAEYMDRKYSELLRAHDLNSVYSPEVLVCKAYKESTFRPQIKTSASNSTASGISQITRSTAVDTFSRGGWFRSKVEGFTHIRNGREFHERMAGSMLAQMEFGMAILDQKRRDRGLSKSSHNIRTILQGYYGSKSQSANRTYANKIMSCANCVEQSGYTSRCLQKVR